MTEIYNIKIFEVRNIENRIFKKEFIEILNTSLVLNIQDHESVMKAVKRIIYKENIVTKDRTFFVHVDIDSNSTCKNGVKYLLHYQNGELIEVEIQVNYYKEFHTGIV